VVNASIGKEGRMVDRNVGEELLEERRRRRRAGDPRITPEGREILARLVDGDLVEEFQAALDAVSAADPLLGGGSSDDTDA
jgi:molybdenum-dependent DNA-binding transcriptional regulator ModE